MSATRKCKCGSRKDAAQVACADCWNKVPQEIRDSFLMARKHQQRNGSHYTHMLLLVKGWLRENVNGWQPKEAGK